MASKGKGEGSSKDYKYASEIQQMMFVFGEVFDPNPETVNLVEDIVRSQVIELIVQARALASKRPGPRTLQAEDLIFLIRRDRGKVNRLRTYLSWKDVRKHAKDSGGEAAVGVEPETMEEGPEGAGQLAGKAQKITIKLPWEITNVFSDVLPNDEEEDEDDVEAHEASLQRLKEADEATKKMSREEYEQYSDCRQASFTYRKAKRFREFLNLPPAIDLKPNDDTVDIVGFLAYEMVRSLTLAGLQVKRSLEDAAFLDGGSPGAAGRKRRLVADDLIASKRRRASDDEEPLVAATCSLFAPPLEARTAIQPEHIQDALARIQNDRHHQRSAGMRNWRGGLIRTKVALI